MKKMIIRKIGSVVVAECLQGGAPEKLIVQYFGTHIIPLPYIGNVDLEEIANNLRKDKANDEYQIVVAVSLAV